MRKNIGLVLKIAVILIIAIGGYYLMKLKQGPYSASSFVSLQYKWGSGPVLLNSYNSSSGNYNFLDDRDSLQKETVKLNANNIIFLHSRATEIGLWDLPDEVTVPAGPLDTAFRYDITFEYEKKRKKIIYYPSHQQASPYRTTASKLVETIVQTIKDAEERNSKN